MRCIIGPQAYNGPLMELRLEWQAKAYFEIELSIVKCFVKSYKKNLEYDASWQIFFGFTAVPLAAIWSS